MSDPSYIDDPYPFESDDDIEIRELDLESVDAFADERITVSDLAGANESWRYGHVIVDEAQDLTPMQWRMVMRRARGQSITIVGDLAQRSVATMAPGADQWDQLLPPELHDARRQDLTVNYRSPAEIHRLAVAVLAEYAPGVTPSTALRSVGIDPVFRQVEDLATALDRAVADAQASVGGQVAVISDDLDGLHSSVARFEASERVRFLTPQQAKGLEFDAVILVEPDAIWNDIGGPAQLYIALTRATQQLVVLYTEQLPAVL